MFNTFSFVLPGDNEIDGDGGEGGGASCVSKGGSASCVDTGGGASCVDPGGSASCVDTGGGASCVDPDGSGSCVTVMVQGRPLQSIRQFLVQNY